LSLTQTPSGGNVEWMAACCDPFFDYCERAVWIVGVVCFILVIIGISLVVFTFYVYMMPFVYHTENGLVFTFYFILGNYLLINIVFHYFSGVYTNPGQTIKGSDVKLTDEQIKLGWKVCYKCDASKPPRAHHCRICGRYDFQIKHILLVYLKLLCNS
jgi:ribosomal protein L40E